VGARPVGVPWVAQVCYLNMVYFGLPTPPEFNSIFAQSPSLFACLSITFGLPV